MIPPVEGGLPLNNANIQTDRKTCNCRNSRCLKLYCECFASGQYCLQNCNCVECKNNVENSVQRQEAVEATLERNPNAFRPKVLPTLNGGGVDECRTTRVGFGDGGGSVKNENVVARRSGS